MPFSMTGIGRANGQIKNPPIKFDVEIKSYNHRFLDVSVKAPICFAPFEEQIKNIIQEKVSRGHIIVIIQQDREILGTRFEVDKPLLNAYMTLAKELKKGYKTTGSININTLLSIPGLIKMSQNQIDTKSIFEEFKPILFKALDEYLAMKKKEGKNTADEITKSLDVIDSQIKIIEKLIPARNEYYKSRLIEILKEFNETFDKERFYQELLYISDRTDVTEECKRFCGHLELIRESLKNDMHPGRRLNFLLQEMQREANTLSVKANYLKISKSVVCIKEEIEKIREQVQNIE